LASFAKPLAQLADFLHSRINKHPTTPGVVINGRKGFLRVADKEIQIVPKRSAFHGSTPFTVPVACRCLSPWGGVKWFDVSFPLPVQCAAHGQRGAAHRPAVIVDLHRELLGQFGGFTIHPTSQGRWQSRAGRVYQEEVVVYEVAIAKDHVAQLRDIVRSLGLRLGQLAMYFDAPSPSVEIIDLSEPPDAAAATGGKADGPRPDKKTGRRGKKDRPAG
jgi:hypothetical protein